MKIKTGELKTHLSHYLKKVRENGERLEVCVREETVAYLIPAQRQSNPHDDGLLDKLSHTGLSLAHSDHRKPHRLPSPLPAKDGRTDIPTVETIRKEKDW